MAHDQRTPGLKIPQNRSDVDITDVDTLDRVVKHLNPDVLVNCAAYTNVDGAESEQQSAHSANTIGVKHLAQVTAKYGVALVHISTDFVFDGCSTQPYTETSSPKPLSVYGQSKWQGEQQIQLHNPNHLIVRTAWLYGDDGHTFPQKLMQWAKQGDVRVANDQTGSPTYAPHLVNGISECLRHGARGIIHLAGSGAVTRYDWAKALFRSLQLDVAVKPVPSSTFVTAAKRPAYSVLESIHPSGVRLPDWNQGLSDFTNHLAKSRK